MFSSAELLAAFLGTAGKRHRCQPFAHSPLACRPWKQGNHFLHLASSPSADGHERAQPTQPCSAFTLGTDIRVKTSHGRYRLRHSCDAWGLMQSGGEQDSQQCGEAESRTLSLIHEHIPIFLPSFLRISEPNWPQAWTKPNPSLICRLNSQGLELLLANVEEQATVPAPRSSQLRHHWSPVKTSTLVGLF